MRPLIRGHIHQVALFIAIGACIFLIAETYKTPALPACLVYSFSLILLYGVSALYHCHVWSRPYYLFMRRLDHGCIYILIAGSATPICWLGLHNAAGQHLMILLWVIATFGLFIAIFWSHAPKWVRTLIYVVMGWIAIPYLSQIETAIGHTDTLLLLIGGIFYTVGAFIYALKKPDPYPTIFGYHEIFHVFVVLASAIHFGVIYNLAT